MKHVENLLKFAAALCCVFALANSPVWVDDAQAQQKPRQQKAVKNQSQEAAPPAAVVPPQPEVVTITTIYGFGFASVPAKDGWKLRCEAGDVRSAKPALHPFVCGGSNEKGSAFFLMIPSKAAKDANTAPTWEVHTEFMPKRYFGNRRFQVIGDPKIETETFGGVSFEIRHYAYSVNPPADGNVQERREIVFFRIKNGPEVIHGHLYGLGDESLDRVELPNKNGHDLRGELRSVMSGFRTIPFSPMVVGSN